MKQNKMKQKMIGVAAIVVMLASLSGCGNKTSDAYSGYEAAYKAMTKSGGLETNFTLELEGDGTSFDSIGNMKLVNESNTTKLYYEMEVGDDTIIQFSDGEYVYTDDGENKTKLAIGNGTKQPERKEDNRLAEKEDGSEFNTEAFFQEFSGMLEAGKIKEMGILDQTPKKYVKEVTATDQGEETKYEFSFSDQMVEMFLNIMIQDQVKNGENTLTFGNLENFVYDATENKDGAIREIHYAGNIDVTVPAALMNSGEEKVFELSIDLKLEVVNPGESIELEFPDTNGYEEI